MNNTPATQSTPSEPRYSVVIPCYDEADNVTQLVDEVGAALANVSDFEILIVDDCSSDDTVARALDARRHHGVHVRVLKHHRNRGQSAAICSGVDAASGRWIVTLDGDGQNDPADIPRLLAVSIDDTVIVCGHRAQRHDTWVRRASSRIANGVRARVLGDATPDTGCGLKVFSRALFMRLPRFDHMHRFLPALVQSVGGSIRSVPITHRARVYGRSKYGIHNRLWVGIVDLFGVMWLKKRRFVSTAIEEFS